MSIGSILVKIPWTRLLAAVPPIVRTARELLQSSQKSGSAVSVTGNETDLQLRIKRLEENEKAQSELVQKITEQVRDTTETLHILSRRLLVLFWLVIFAFLLSIASLILVLQK